MNERDKKWNKQYENLVEFKTKNGHCVMQRKKNKDDAYLGNWVHEQRKIHNHNKLRLDRKERLDEIGFAWKADGDHTFKPDDKLWHQQYKKLVEFKRKTGHCKVPRQYEQDKSLGRWVATQRTFHKDDKLRLDRKKLLDDIGFAWKAHTLAAPSSPTNVRSLVIRSFSTLGADHVSHSRSFSAYFCVEYGVGSVHQQCGSPKINTR
jgi:hypothetical protein